MDSDEELRERYRGACASVPPPPELYEELIADGSWPLAISKIDAIRYWARKKHVVLAHLRI
ncbi:hypothetical protein LCGC14_0478900 [marine sediment metagenome]|uniref:Uncharacterized protein n=1 Tax=marine sediment metagenome TaxID=412755 RepID=A0A0F9UX21_9ZZZZ